MSGPYCIYRMDPKASPAASRDVVAVLTHRVLAMALEELRSEETRTYVNEHLVRPLLRAVLAETAPYAIALTAVIAAMLLMTALTLTVNLFPNIIPRGGASAL